MNSDNRHTSVKENEARLAGLYEEYYDRIAHYVYVRIGNRAEAEDIAGEVFLKALKSLKSYRDKGIPMQGWLFRIAHNLVVDYLRRMTKRKTVPIDSLALPDADDPVDQAERNMEMARVTEAMKQLTEEQREVINLRFFGGLTSKEAGEVLRKSDGAVREMQRAAIEKLRGIMGAEC
ncbi:MAG: sigma-70 family RNA polymerase sigma factor [Dehalococcoidia bacterium]|jgi:RNA polymerase sigma-70 factor (ECF subfamily)|nr:MAG: sigma-70 family RNA polymerase sigma factor [Dehalococcoidia bacterium]